MLASILERHADKISGVLGCYDRVLIRSTVPGLCYAEGMASFLRWHKVRFFDYPKFFEPYRKEIVANAEGLAKKHGFEIEFMRKTSFRKDERIAEVLAKRGDSPGLVYILSAMEACPSYRGWHDKKTGRNFLKPVAGKCLHYYFYFLDAELGLCYIRVPTWAPFGLQFYFNGHNQLAAKLRGAGVEFQMLDNAFPTSPRHSGSRTTSTSPSFTRQWIAMRRSAAHRWRSSRRASTGASCKSSIRPTSYSSGRSILLRSTTRSLAPPSTQ